MKSVMTHQFSQVPSVEIPRSSFDRSHGYKTTMDAGYLVPIFVDEALPGDSFNVNGTLFGRLNTPVVPIMDNMRLETFFFAVPVRLIWDNFVKMMGERRNPTDSIDYLVPTMTAPVGGYTAHSLSDYFGLPTGIAGYTHSSLWHRAYNLIYNEWFRDQNLQNSVVVDTDDGPDDPADYTLLKRGKRHDYFTSCLPWPQKGDTVDVPIGTSAPVVYDTTSVNAVLARNAGTNALLGTSTMQIDAAGNVENNVPTNIKFDPNGTLYADLTTATAATINQLREAFQIQRLIERDARGGSRYIEINRSHFGVVSPDARLQRPEYLGGGSSFISVTPIAQTSSTDATTPQGNLAAMGVVSGGEHGFTKSFTEHCVIIGLACVRADLTYQQGLDRMFSRSTRYDFYWPALAHLGEQAVLNKEIYLDGTATDEDVFGYQERYAEYRYKPSRITGLFRSTAATPLDVWHLSQHFTARPALNATFIAEDPPIDRVVAVPAEPHFMLDCYFNFRAARPMPMYSVPGMIDHF